MQDTPKATPVPAAVRTDAIRSVGRRVFQDFNAAFALTSLIPLLIAVYVLAARLFTLSVFEGITGVYFFIAVILALLGFLMGRRILESIVAKLLQANTQLRQHEDLKSAFVANVAYELRAPLTAVHLSLQNLSDGLEGPLTASQVGTVTTCRGIVGRLVRLVSDLIGVTDAQSARPQLARDVVNLQALLQDVVRASEPSLSPQQLRVAVQVSEEPVMFFGDRAKLLQAFGSLMDHAVRWSEAGSTIALELRRVLEGWQVVVSHTIAPHQAEMARAFESMRRLGAKPEEYLGLGLHLANEIVEQHYGRFWVEGEPGRNVRLIVTLPMPEQPQAAPAR